MYSSSRSYAFPVVWLAVLATGTALYRPASVMDATASLSAKIGRPAVTAELPVFLSKTPYAQQIAFVSHDPGEPEGVALVTTRDFLGGHGRFAAPGNAVRRQVRLTAINPRTADELAGFFRDASYTLASIRAGEPVPPIKLTKVPDDLANKDGTARKLGLDPAKVVSTVALHGNTSAASVPLALVTAVRDGRIKRGDLVLLEAMGGGFTWAAALLRW